MKLLRRLLLRLVVIESTLVPAPGCHCRPLQHCCTRLTGGRLKLWRLPPNAHKPYRPGMRRHTPWPHWIGPPLPIRFLRWIEQDYAKPWTDEVCRRDGRGGKDAA